MALSRQRWGKIAAIALAITLVLGIVSTALAFDKVNYANADPNKYRVELDLTNKVVTVFERDTKGKYSKIAKQFICTPGASSTPTPQGSFRLNDSRRRFGYFKEFGVYAQYWTNVSGGIYFHSILYTRQKEGYFTHASYNRLGNQGSHGCIRLLVEDARWIYYNCPAGTYGEILKREKNEKLRKSLLPKVSASKYKPTGDEYEAAARSVPMAIVKQHAIFTDTKKNSYVVRKNTPVSIVSSGSISCRVHVAGIEGHIETKYLGFLPNGPQDQVNLKKVNTKAAGYYTVNVKTTALLAKAAPSAKVLGNFGSGTQLKLLGSTANYLKAEIDGKTGYIAKKDVSYQFAPKLDALVAVSTDKKPAATPQPTVKPTAKPTATPTPTPVETPASATPSPATQAPTETVPTEPTETDSALESAYVDLNAAFEG